MFSYHPDLVTEIGNKGNILLTSISILSSKFIEWSKEPNSMPPSGSIVDVITIAEENSEKDAEKKVIKTEFLIRKNI